MRLYLSIQTYLGTEDYIIESFHFMIHDDGCDNMSMNRSRQSGSNISKLLKDNVRHSIKLISSNVSQK